MICQARWLTETIDMSGKAERHFYEPTRHRSMPQSSTRRGALPALATAST